MRIDYDIVPAGMYPANGYLTVNNEWALEKCKVFHWSAVVAHDAGRLLGVLTFTHIGDVLEVEDVWTRCDVRGRGLATNLWAVVLDTCGLWRVIVEVASPAGAAMVRSVMRQRPDLRWCVTDLMLLAERVAA